MYNRINGNLERTEYARCVSYLDDKRPCPRSPPFAGFQTKVDGIKIIYIRRFFRRYWIHVLILFMIYNARMA